MEHSIDKFLPIFIRGLINTTYIPEPTNSVKVIDLQLYLDHTPLKMEVVREEPNEKDFEQVLKLTRAHIPISGIRLLVVAICTLLYDCPKIKAMTRSAMEEPLKGVFARIPDLLQPNIEVNCDGVEFDDAFTAMQALGVGQPQSESNGNGQAQAEGSGERSIVMKFAGQEPTTVTAPVDGTTASNRYPTQQGGNGAGTVQLHKHLGLTPLAAKNLGPISTNTINTVFKYCIYALSHQKYMEFLLANKGTVYNPLIDDDNAQISEEACNDPKKSEKEREILQKIRVEQLEVSRKSRESKTIPIIESFSLRSLLNIIFRLFSHTLDITRSVVSINDYVGEITYGEDEEDDLMMAQEAMMSMMMMGARGDPNDPKTKAMQASMDNFLQMMGGADALKAKQQEEEPPSTGSQANKEETNRLMNAKWLYPIRASIDWSQAFTNNRELVATGGASQRQMMLLGKLGMGGVSAKDVMRVGALQEEEQMVDRLADYDMASHLRSKRQ